MRKTLSLLVIRLILIRVDGSSLYRPTPLSSAGVENVSDHGTIGLRKFLGLPENILSFRNKKELLARHKGKILIGRKYIELENVKS